MAKHGNFDQFKKKPSKKSSAKAEKKRKKTESIRKKSFKAAKKSEATIDSAPVRLNRFIASAGVCSRRDADVLISEGRVQLNGKITTELGTKVVAGKDIVVVDGKRITPDLHVYVLMNKPKDHITTTEDDRGRRTVMDIVSQYTKVRVFPVGRLDRNTTGLLLFTNDGMIAEKLMHPSNKIKKVYEVRLDRNLEEEDLEKILKGVELEDGKAKADKAGYLSGAANEIYLEIHSGKNRVVRRIFESLGYRVKKLDRVSLGPLTKKRLPRGKCRQLSSQEIGWLHML